METKPQEVKKSDLQIKLESEGWRFMENLYVGEDKCPYSDPIPNYREVHKEVEISNAYDIYGDIVPEHVSIYVRD